MILQEPDKRDLLYQTVFRVNRTADRVILDAREILDQRKFGTCVAFGIAGATNNLYRDLTAPLFNYRKTKEIDLWPTEEGTTIKYGLKAYQQFGNVPDKLYPYAEYQTKFVFPPIPEVVEEKANDYKIDAYVKITTPEELADHLLHGVGAIGGFTVGLTSFFNPERLPNGDAIVDMPLGQIAGHAVYICGIDFNMTYTYKDGTTRKGFVKVANSWGTGASRREFGTDDVVIWSETGYGWIPFDYIFGKMYAPDGSLTSYVNEIFAPLKDIPFTMTKIDNISDETKPYIKNNRTLVPLRFIGELLGLDVLYNEHAKGITLNKNGLIVKLNVDSKHMQVNNQFIELDTAPEIKNNRTFVPLRAISEAFNCKVKYFDTERKVEIQNEYVIIELWVDYNEARIITKS